MSVSDSSIQDGLFFAHSIRALANDARDLLRGSATDDEWFELLGRIERLEEEAGYRSSGELVSWLASLRRLVSERELATL